MVYNTLNHWVYGLRNSQTQSLRSVLSKRPKPVRVSFSSPEDEEIFSFRNVIFSSYIDLRKMEEVPKPSDSETIYSLEILPFLW
jgi:hypothetical protein